MAHTSIHSTRCGCSIGLSRRDWCRLTAAGVVGFSMSGWLESLAAEAAADPKRRRACILLWMNGGPSHMDTFDLKPGHANGGSFKEIETSVPGMKISEHLPKIARLADQMAIIRSMSTKEADHGRATYTMRTGHVPGGVIQYPTLGSLLAKELERAQAELPGFVSIAPSRFLSPGAYGAGFLGPRYAPLIVGENAEGRGERPELALKVENLDLPQGIDKDRATSRLELLETMQQDFLSRRSDLPAESHRSAYQRAAVMMHSASAKAFDLDEEPAELRDRYGRSLFGQGCLLARRLVERGVPFVEVTLSGWDTHQDNFNQVQRLSGTLDAGWSTLMSDLRERGLLDSTLIVWAGEFGRTPKINENTGRDHWAQSWSTVLSGGGIRGGQVIGRTSADGTTVEERPVAVADFLATVCMALGLDTSRQNESNVGRPIRLIEPGAQPIKEILS